MLISENNRLKEELCAQYEEVDRLKSRTPESGKKVVTPPKASPGKDSSAEVAELNATIERLEGELQEAWFKCET